MRTSAKVVCAVLTLMLLLTACGSTAAADPKSLVQVAKDNTEKAKQYHELVGKAKEAQAHVQQFVGDWLKACEAVSKTIGQPLKLQMAQDGDPGCTLVDVPAQAAPAPQSSQSPQAPPPQAPHK